jgi:hypothetical protein
MHDFKRRIINEAIKHGAKSSNIHDIGINRDNINSWDWDESRDGWEGKQQIEEKKTVAEDEDYDGEMAMTLLKNISEKTNELLTLVNAEMELEPWVQSKITMAEDYITVVRDYIKHKDHAEGVVVDGDDITEAQAVSGKYRFNSFKEGSISGWKVSIQSKGEVGFIEEPAKKNTRTSISPHKLFLYGKKEGEPDFVLSLWPSKETRMVGEREMRYAPRQLFNAVAMWMDKYGSKMVK